MNIIELLDADGITVVHASRNEYHSPCPFCGGRDRFSSWPAMSNSSGRFLGGRYVCRGCGRFGDAVSYLKERHGLTYRQACESLGIDPGQPATTLIASREWQPREPDSLPGEVWQARAMTFFLYCQRQLERNQGAIDWLRTERGLTSETVKAAQLGFNPSDIYDSREAWGMEPAINHRTGQSKKQWLPKGLVIPLCPGDQIIRLRIRRTVADSFGRYIVISGSSNRPMAFGQDHPGVAIVESELDALLLWQECRDLIGVIALGSAQAKPNSELDARLKQVRTLLCSLDSDAPGAKASVFWRRYPGFKRWPAVRGKDPNEQRLAGVSVRSWVMAAFLERNYCK